MKNSPTFEYGTIWNLYIITTTLSISSMHLKLATISLQPFHIPFTIYSTSCSIYRGINHHILQRIRKSWISTKPLLLRKSVYLIFCGKHSVSLMFWCGPSEVFSFLALLESKIIHFKILNTSPAFRHLSCFFKVR